MHVVSLLLCSCTYSTKNMNQCREMTVIWYQESCIYLLRLSCVS